MKIVALLAGPRQKGNTAVLMQKVLQEAETLGAQTEIFSLNKLNMKGCQGCYGCKRNPTCVIKDDAQQVLAAIAEADRIVLATPVYMWDMAGQLKIMIDRFFSFMNMDYTSKLTQGKKVLWTITQGQPDVDKFRTVFEQHAAMMEFLGFGENKLFITGGMMMPGDAEARTDVMEKAAAMAKWLVEE